MPLSEEQAWPLAQRIAGGHSWHQHRRDFPEVESADELAALVLSILTAPDAERTLRRGRSAYWHELSGTIVLVSPRDPDGGTCFRPDNERRFFETVP